MLSPKNQKSKIRNQKSDLGFTLIEIMVATTITMMIIGSIYAAFRSSLNAYERDETQIIMLQRCRSALDRMSRDMSNLFYVADDEEMVIMSEDYVDDETEADKDMVSFVAVVEPRFEEYYLIKEEQSNELLLDEEEDNPLPSDLARVLYYIGPNPEDETVQSLMRIQTSNLDIEEFDTMLEDVMSGSPSEDVEEELPASVLVDYVAGLNIRYFDGEDWIDQWDMEEQEGLPAGIELTLTITDAETQEKTLTQSTVIYLPFYKPPTNETTMQMGGAGAQ